MGALAPISANAGESSVNQNSKIFFTPRISLHPTCRFYKPQSLAFCLSVSRLLPQCRNVYCGRRLANYRKKEQSYPCADQYEEARAQYNAAPPLFRAAQDKGGEAWTHERLAHIPYGPETETI